MYPFEYPFPYQYNLIMDPCQFLQIIIGNMAIKLPTTTTTVISTTTTCYCKIKFSDFPQQVVSIPILQPDSTHPDPAHVHPVSACFTLTRSGFKKQSSSSKRPVLKIDVYSGGSGKAVCGFGSVGKLLGRVSVPLELTQQAAEGKASTVMQNGWVFVGGERKGLNSRPQLYLSVKAQPDPRFVFEFDGEPECSPQVFQVQGNIRQPVFTCKFSFRQSGEWNLRSSSTMSEPSTSRSWLSSLKADKDHHHQTQVKERKGWSITIHDLSGSPVAAASMVTPFVPSQGSDRVSRSNPGAWLILRPGDNTWKPWGRLEAWRDRAGPASSDGLGHRFELLSDAGLTSVMGPTGITLAQSTIPTRTGGKFDIDITTGASPAGSPNSSFDFASWSGSGSNSSSGSEAGSGSGWWPGFMYKGFVMSSTVGGEGKSSKPVVEVGAQHVTCTEDAAAFVALAAAMDLSMDACRPFSRRLRKELSGDFVV